MLDGSTILITGGLGLVGLSALGYVEYLRQTFSAKINLTLSAKTDAALPISGRFGTDFAFLQGSLEDVGFLDSLPQFDYIIHAGGYGQPGRFLSDPFSTLSVNSLATIRLRSKANLGFLFVSSSEIYSGLEQSHISEEEIGTTTPSHPRSPYIEGKRFGEAASLLESNYGARYGSVARLSLAYGPGTRVDDQRVMNELIVRGITDRAVALRDPGDRLRTYCYAEDAVEMLFGILKEGAGQVFNVGGHSTTSIRHLGELVALSLGVTFSAPEAALQPDSSPLSVNLDVSKASNLIGKKDFVPLEVGLEQTISWYRSLLK
jgi:nucleoside-diphosphate-sugar epimerase